MKFIRKSAPDKKAVRKLADGLGVSAQMAALLIMRGYADKSEAEAFLHPSLSNLHEPLFLGDMDNACARIEAAIADGERICVYGDYDVDGIAASAILYKYMGSRGADVECYIPSRHSEGYGLNKGAIEKLNARGVNLIITVDCGISAADEVEYIKRHGMDVIITDHHEPPEKLPLSTVIDPKCAGDYPFDALCGAGVVGKLVDALSEGEALEDYLDLIALATMADVVPLVDENRILVAEGIKRIKSNKCNIGIDRLCAVSGVDRMSITSRDIAFMLGPRINAAGRMGDPMRGFELLTTQDAQRADELALELHRENEARRESELKALAQAKEMIAATSDFLSERAIVIRGDEWNEGILGLIASRIVKEYGLPAVVLREKDGELIGSARSSGDLNLYEAIADCACCLERFGGHRKAAGLTLKNDKFDDFKATFMASVIKRTTPLSFLPSYEYDLDVAINDLSIGFAAECMLIAPFGEGNPAPHICVKGAPRSVSTMGRDGSHLRFELADGNRSVSMVAFGMGSRAAEIGGQSALECLAEIGIDRWRGEERLRMNLVEARSLIDELSEPENRDEKLMRAFLYEIGYNNKLASKDERALFVSAEDLERRIETDVYECASGVMFCSYDAETHSSLYERLKSRSLEETVSWTGTSSHLARPIVCAVSPPDWGGIAERGYRRIYLMDGQLFDGTADALAATFGAEVVCAKDIAPQAQGELGRMLKGFDRERLGRIYSWMRGFYKADRVMLLANSPFAAWEVLAALDIFAELGLAEEDSDGAYHFEAQRHEKRDLNESTIYRALCGLSERG